MKKVILIYIALASLELFNLAFLGVDFIKGFQLTGIGLLGIILIIKFLYMKEINFPKHFNLEIFLIFLGVAVSMVMAQVGHDQSLGTTFIAQRFMYFYLVYWALHAIKISAEDLEKIIVWMGVTFSVLYVIQFILYPTVVFDVRIAEDRGTIRIFMPGFTFLVLAYFLVMNRLFESFSVSRLLSFLLFISILVLMGTRQVIFSVLLLTIMNVLFSQRVKSKVLIVFLLLGSIVPVIIVFQEIFISLVELSKNQSENLAENVRIRATVFFLTELFPNTYAYLTGNGADSTNSTYGFMIQMYKDAYGFYQSDIGIIGDYTKFGVAFVLGAFIIIFKMIFGKLNPEITYLRYFYLSVLLTLFTGGGPFAMADAIVAICFTLYIVDVGRFDLEDEAEEGEEELLEEQPIITHERYN